MNARKNPAKSVAERPSGGFTLIELLVVIAIIAILAGLILGAAGNIQKKGARSRAESEIAALSAALENFKADFGEYPRTNATDTLVASNSFNPSSYIAASQFLYQVLMGTNNNVNTNRVYYDFNSRMLSPTNVSGTNFVIDPFGFSYGYSTASNSFNGSNFFDLWSTAGQTAAGGTNGWIKNW